MTFAPLPGFDWSKVTWGRPDSVVSPLCSYCSAVIPEDAVPLILWLPKGLTARFCDACAATHWGFLVELDPDFDEGTFEP
jgi:hypothetical protein